MLKKRIIFALLYSDGHFFQSRNFNIQRVGNVDWLEKNYNFKKISYYIDELLVIDISRNERKIEQFLKDLNSITKFCFIPISVGGGINSIKLVKKILSNGADKVLINSNANFKFMNEISKIYGQQSIICSVDFKLINNEYKVFIRNGSQMLKISLSNYLKRLNTFPIGEIMLNSIDQDGTGNGLDFKALKNLPKKVEKSLIISGGCGNSLHISEGLDHEQINAVSTANLLNFVGDGLKKAREEMIKKKYNLPIWDVQMINKLENNLKKI
tara:strand:+ start:360 stop:1166 length:807 start_codon:yes stop_codon:yes gene_type:complete